MEDEAYVSKWKRHRNIEKIIQCADPQKFEFECSSRRGTKKITRRTWRTTSDFFVNATMKCVKFEFLN